MNDTDRLKGVILHLAQQLNFDGKSWKWFAEQLNEKGFTTQSGKRFSPKNLQRFCKRHELDFKRPRREFESHFETTRPDIQETEESRLKQKMRVSRNEVEPPGVPRVPDLPPWLLDDLDKLRALLDWWKSRPEATFNTPEPRPIFSGDSKNTGIRINKKILERATAQAKEQRFQTGGSLSQLVELLLWRYIGSPKDVLDRSE